MLTEQSLIAIGTGLSIANRFVRLVNVVILLVQGFGVMFFQLIILNVRIYSAGVTDPCANVCETDTAHIFIQQEQGHQKTWQTTDI